MKTADEVLKEQFGHAYGMLHPFEISRITSAMQAYASEFNKPPVYGQFVNPTEDEVMLFICDAYNVFVETRDKFKLMDFILDKTPHRIISLPPSPGSVDVEEKKDIIDGKINRHAGFKVDGLGDSSGSEKEFTSQEVFEWFQTKRFQREQGTQEYTMIYEIDLPKIINQFIKDKLA